MRTENYEKLLKNLQKKYEEYQQACLDLDPEFNKIMNEKMTKETKTREDIEELMDMAHDLNRIYSRASRKIYEYVYIISERIQ